MRYLDFSTVESVMRSIFFEDFIGVRGACVRASVCVGQGVVEVRILIVLLSVGEGSVNIAPSRISCKYSV